MVDARKIVVYGVAVDDTRSVVRTVPYGEAAWGREMQSADAHNRLRTGGSGGTRLVVAVEPGTPEQ